MTVSFKTFGCRLNQAEAAQFATAFEAAGFRQVPFGSDAHVMVFHSCTVTWKAENECLKVIRKTRLAHPSAWIVLTGCAVATCDPAQLQGLVDERVPVDAKDDLVNRVLKRLGVPAIERPRIVKPTTQRAILKIQDGCDFFCAYCIVPHARGAPWSRPLDACVEEARAMIDAGFQELVVTGCNTACYRDGTNTLLDLLQALLALPGLGRIRLGSIEPGTVERELIGLMVSDTHLCRFLHLPVQSGSDAVLAGMRRRYRIRHIRATLDDALSRIPDLSLGTDVIAGFPGETEDAFQQTVDLVTAYPWSNVHVFPYSERPGTPAVTFDGKVPGRVRKMRSQELMRIGAQKKEQYASRFVGRPVTFLVEHFANDGTACGWSAEYLACRVTGVLRQQRRTLVCFHPERAEDGVLHGYVGIHQT